MLTPTNVFPLKNSRNAKQFSVNVDNTCAWMHMGSHVGFAPMSRAASLISQGVNGNTVTPCDSTVSLNTRATRAQQQTRLHHGLRAAKALTTAHDDAVVIARDRPILARVASFHHVSIVQRGLHQHGKGRFERVAQSVRHNVVAVKAELQAAAAGAVQHWAARPPLRHMALSNNGATGKRRCVKAYR